MTTINWPVALPFPQFDASAGTEAPVLVTTMDSGRRRQRNRFSANVKIWNVFFNMTESQYLLFLAFHKHKLSNGALSFNINLPNAFEDTAEVIILEGKFSETPLSDQYIRVSVTLLQHDPSTPDELWLYLWEWYEGDPESLLDIDSALDEYVNETRPSHY